MILKELNIFDFSFGYLRKRLLRLNAMPPFLAVIAGTVAASHLAVEVWQWALIAAASALLIFCFESVRALSRVMMFASLAATIYTYGQRPDIPLRTPLQMALTITEEGILRQAYRTYTAQAVVENLPPFTIEVRTPQNLVMQRGDRFNLCSKINPFSKRNSSYLQNRERRGYVGTVTATPNNIEDFTPLNRPLLQHRIIELFRRGSTPSQGEAAALAIGLGYRSDIASNARAYFNVCGLSHLLAISGLHVGLVLMLLSFTFRPLTLVWRGLELQFIATIGAIWLYVWLCGMPPSAVRAAAMFSLMAALRLRADGGVSPLNNLLRALTIMFLLSPSLIFDAGMKLSAVAVAAIVIYAVPVMRCFRNPWSPFGIAAKLMLVAMVATLALLPLTARLFGVVSFISIFINPVAVGLGFATLICVLTSAALPQPVQGWLIDIATTCGSMLNDIAEQLSSLGIGYAYAKLDDTGAVAIYTVVIIITLFLAGFRRRERWNLEDI